MDSCSSRWGTWRCQLATAVLTFAVLCGTTTATATAVTPATQGHEQQVAAALRNYTGVSQEVCDATCTAVLNRLRGTSTSTAPSSAGARAVLTEAAQFGWKARLMAPVSSLGVLSIANSVTTTFAVGFGIGTIANHMIFHFGMDVSRPNQAGVTVTNQNLYPVAKGHKIHDYTTACSSGILCVQEDGFLWTYTKTTSAGTQAGWDSTYYYADDETDTSYWPPCPNGATQLKDPARGQMTYCFFGASSMELDDPPSSSGSYDSLQGYPSPIPTLGDTTNDIGSYLDDFPNLRDTIDNVLGGPGQDPADPLVEETVPSCEGLSYAACVDALEEAGFDGTKTRVVLDFDQADLDSPAGSVILTAPAEGQEVDIGSAFAITTNPEAADMPFLVPEFDTAPGEDGELFVEELEGLGLDAAPIYENIEYDGGTVYETDPPSGTRVLPADPIQVRIKTRSEPNRCETPTNEDPGTSRGWNVETSQYDVVGTPPVSGGTFIDSDGNHAELRWGRTQPTQKKRGGFAVRWEGWGYRKIKAKHGWGTDIEARTRTAMTAGLAVPDDVADHSEMIRYYGPPFSRSQGVICQQIVVAQYRQSVDEASAERPAKGIITSYAQEVGVEVPAELADL